MLLQKSLSDWPRLWLGLLSLLGLMLAMPARTATLCPATESVPTDFQWGLVAYHVNLPGYDLQADDLAKMAQNGIQWIRVDFAWGRIEPQQGGNFDFSYFDALVAAAKANGMRIAGTLGNGYNTRLRPVAPLWTRKLSGPQYVAALGRYADAVVERYADEVDSWGLENELNFAIVHVFFGWRTRVYSPRINQEILRTLSQAVDRHDPSAQIVLTVSPDPIIPGWQDFLSQSTQRFRYDAVGLYSYPSMSVGAPPTGFEAEVANQIAEAREASGGRDVLIYETGYQTPPDKPRTPENENSLLRDYQATYIETMARAAVDGGAAGVYFYQYLDNPNEFLPREKVFGLLEPDRTPKPAWTRYGEIINACRIGF